MSNISYLQLMALITIFKGGLSMDMELLNLTVPQDMCALDFLAEMKERTKNAWIFLHDSVISKLLKSDGVKCKERSHNCRILSWEATDEYPATQVVISSFKAKGWYSVIAIKAEDIAFKEIDNIEEPERIIRLKMAA